MRPGVNRKFGLIRRNFPVDGHGSIGFHQQVRFALADDWRLETDDRRLTTEDEQGMMSSVLHLDA
jgi:hypothetical protein